MTFGIDRTYTYICTNTHIYMYMLRPLKLSSRSQLILTTIGKDVNSSSSNEDGQDRSTLDLSTIIESDCYPEHNNDKNTTTHEGGCESQDCAG